MLIGDIVDNNVQQYGDCEALVSPDQRVETWTSLWQRTNRMARAILSLGLRHGDRLAILAPNCPEYIEYFIVCARTGVIGSPVSPRLRNDEIAAYLRYTEPTAILIHTDLAEDAHLWLKDVPSLRHHIGFGGPHPFTLDLQTLSAAEDSGELTLNVTEDDIYQLCPTSGTTGVVKGAIVSQRNAITAMFGWLSDFEMREQETHLQSIGLFFNSGGPAAGMSSVFLRGGRTVVPPRFEPEMFLRCVQDYHVNHSTVVPTMLAMLLEHPKFYDYDLSSMRSLSIGGAPVPRALVEKLGDRLGIAYPMYGMAETYSSGLLLRPEHREILSRAQSSPELLSAGRPQPYICARVVGSNGEDVPRDGKSPGELWFRGDSVSRGYYKMTQETEGSRSGGWLMTGDIAVIDIFGFFTLVDRKKDMIISGGLKITSREVEEAIALHPSVSEVAVIGIPNAKWGESVHAVVVLHEQDEATEESIRQFAAASLAGYKCPSSVELISELPRTSTGKVLKRELRERYRLAH